MTPESIKQIIENLKTKGFEPTHQTIEKNITEVHYQSSYVMFQHTTDLPSVELSLPIHYDMTFDQTNINYLNKKGITYWEIHKHWLKFIYQPKDEKDLEKTLQELLETYDY